MGSIPLAFGSYGHVDSLVFVDQPQPIKPEPLPIGSFALIVH